VDDGTEWSTRWCDEPYWLVRTLSGISMDTGDVPVGHQPDDDCVDQARRSEGSGPAPGVAPFPRRVGAMNARFVALVAGVGFFFLAS